jgi:hypothetical protein
MSIVTLHYLKVGVRSRIGLIVIGMKITVVGVTVFNARMNQ